MVGTIFQETENKQMSTSPEITRLTEEWIELLQTSGEEAALEYYSDKIIPALLPMLHEKFKDTHNRIVQYDGLISLLGFAPDTVILTYHFIRPETLVVIHTKETKQFLDTVLRHTKVPVASFFHESFSETPYTDIYRALESALKRFPKGSRIAIELTGGKKTMSGALAIASGILEIDLLYIDYTKYMPEYRKPRPESTYMQLVGNPLKLPVDLFSEIEIERAVNFFNVGKYDMSRTLFEQASQRMATPRAAEVCADLSHLYVQWNMFAFKESHEMSVNLFDKLIRFIDQISAIFRFDVDRLKKQMSTLLDLSQGNRVSLLFNFYFSAERYQRNGQNDIAALLYYRTIESVFENALKDTNEGFEGENPIYSLLTNDEIALRDDFIRHRSTVYKANEQSDIQFPSQLGMFDALCLLCALNHRITQKIKLGRVAHIARIRNRSVYAHGIQPIDTASISDIRKLAVDALEEYLAVAQHPSITERRPSFEFMELSIRRNRP
jgi:CRISPR-associated protein (Cas_Cas02710)